MTDDAKARFEEIKRTMEQFERMSFNFAHEEKQLLHTLLHKLSTEWEVTYHERTHLDEKTFIAVSW